MKPLLADTTLNSGTTTVNTGTNFAGSLFVASTGTATMNVVAGGYATNTFGYIGQSAGSRGTVTVSGGTWANTNDFTVGNSGTGELNVTGGIVTNLVCVIGLGSSGNGTVNVSSGTWATSANLGVGNGGTGTLNITGGLVSVAGFLSRNTRGTINLNSGGTLQIGTGTTSGVLLDGIGSLVNNGTLIFNRSDASTYSGVISGSGAVTKQGGGTLTLSASSSYTGGTMINDGVLALGSLNAVGTSGTISFGGGTLRYSASNTTDYSSRFSTAASQAYEIDTNGQNVTLASPLASSGGGLTKSGAGTLTLSGSNTYTGNTSVAGGILALSTPAALPGESDAGRWSVAANTGLTFGANGLTNTEADALVISATTTGNLASGAAVGFDTTGVGTYTYANVLPVSAGSGLGFAASGNGSLVVTGSNTYVGPTIVGSGTLSIGDGGTAGWIGATSGVTAGPGATLAFNRSDDYGGTFDRTISGSGGIAVSSGTLAISGSNTFSGTATLAGGQLVVSNQNALPNATLSLDGGSVAFANASGTAFTLGGLSGTTGGMALVNTAGDAISLNVGRNNTLSTVAASISGSGSLTKAGSGILTLAGSNSYTGGTTISSGTLSLGNTNALGSSGTISFVGGTLQYSMSNETDYSDRFSAAANQSYLIDTNGRSVTFGSSLSSSGGTLTKLGSGTLALSGSNTYTGGTTIQAGVLSVTAGGAVSHSGTRIIIGLSSGDVGVLNLTGGSVTSLTGTLGSGSGSLGTATVTSGTWANGGSLIIGGSGNGALVVDGGSLTTASGTIGRFTRSSGTATVTSGTWIMSGNLVVGSSGTGRLVMSGGLVTVGGTLSKAGGSLGVISLNAGGTLQIGVGGTIGVLNITPLANNGTLVFNRSNAATHTGLISGAGAVTTQGAGRLTLTNGNTYTGLTTIAAGTLALSGTGSIGTGGLNLGTTGSPGVFDLAALTASTYSLPSSASLAGVGTLSGNGKSLAVLGSLAPGNSAGTITVGSGLSLDLANSGTSLFEITNPAFTAGTYDLVSGDGSVVFGGILNLAFSGGSYAEGTDVLQIFTNTGGRSGNFSAVNATGLGAGQSATFSPATGFITVVPEPSSYAISAIATAGLASLMRWRKRWARESTA